MTEIIVNGIQTAVLAVCFVIALLKAVRTRDRAWALLAFFYFGWMLGDAYWQICMIFYGDTPDVSIVSDITWYAAFIFLYMLIRQTATPENGAVRTFLPWLGPIFTVAMAVYYMQFGQYVSNVIYAGLLGLILLAVIRRLTEREKYANARFLCLAAGLFCLFEHGEWVSSCIVSGYDSILNPYFIFDLLLTACFVVFIPATRKAVKA